ncbi:hypothetical protein RclHR1_09530009 [Rhizophagus clarus]|uniref:Uncharacterized protein n=1 Tax=Rhizophagus clarus TaxID=94130 RepID=A0A2Z6S4S1_9GLOM|nr:hypothetical protein RclHR1_09530009 [Rhizophagus clarus]
MVAEQTILLTNATSSTIERPNNYYLSYNTNDNFSFYQENDPSFQRIFGDNAFGTEPDNSRYQDHAKENLLNLEEVKNSKKRKTSDIRSQAWSDEETNKLLDFLKENFNRYQKESVKGRLSRLLEKY